MKAFRIFSALAIPALAGFLMAQAPAQSSADVAAGDAAASQADAAYTQHDWQAAEKLYASLTKQSPENARYWYRLAVCERADKEYAPALEAFQKAGELAGGKGLPQSTL